MKSPNNPCPTNATAPVRVLVVLSGTGFDSPHQQPNIAEQWKAVESALAEKFGNRFEMHAVSSRRCMTFDTDSGLLKAPGIGIDLQQFDVLAIANWSRLTRSSRTRFELVEFLTAAGVTVVTAA